MALVLNDRVKETSTTTGTGTFSLGGAVDGFESFVTGIANSNTTYYAAVNRDANEFEVGIGTVTDASPDTLARTTILSSSNSDSAVDFSAGTKDIFTTLPASKAIFEDASNDVTIGNDLILGSDSAVLKFGADSDTTLTHTDGTGLTLNSTNKLLFRDTGLYINSSTDGQLDIVADTEIQIAATTIDINGAVALNGAITGATNITLSGELDAATLDISGDADIDGTLEADAITIGGVTLAETISDTVGAMVTSNTESGITVAYQDADNTLDFTIGTLNQNTTGSAATLTTARTIGGTSFDGSANIAVGLADTATALATARTIGGTSFDGTGNIDVALAAVGTAVTVADESSDTTCFPLFATAATGDLPPKSGSNLTFNSSSGLLTATLLAGNLTGDVTGNVTGNVSGTAATVTTAAQSNITSLGTLTTLTVDDITINGSTISDGADLLIDAEGDISLDANGANVIFKDDGTSILDISNSSTDAVLTVSTQDKDLIIKGDDGGAAITALTIDMSDAGKLLPNNGMDLNGKELILDADADTSITADTDDQIHVKIANADHLQISGSGGNTVFKPMTNNKNIVIQQFDGNELVQFSDGNFSSFTRAALHPEATLTDASTISWNALTQPVAKVTLGDNRTLGAASGGITGQFVSILIIQDGTGSRTVTFNGAYEFAADAAPTLTTTASKGDLFVFRYNGAKWLEVGRNLALTLS